VQRCVVPVVFRPRLPDVIISQPITELARRFPDIDPDGVVVSTEKPIDQIEEGWVMVNVTRIKRDRFTGQSTDGRVGIAECFPLEPQHVRLNRGPHCIENALPVTARPETFPPREIDLGAVGALYPEPAVSTPHHAVDPHEKMLDAGPGLFRDVGMPRQQAADKGGVAVSERCLERRGIDHRPDRRFSVFFSWVRCVADRDRGCHDAKTPA